MTERAILVVMPDRQHTTAMLTPSLVGNNWHEPVDLSSCRLCSFALLVHQTVDRCVFIVIIHLWDLLLVTLLLRWARGPHRQPVRTQP
jgi:hypothetical protein